MKKRIICLFICILISLSFIQCGKEEAYDGISVWVNCSEDEKEQYNKLLKQFTEETGIKAKVRAYEFDATNYSMFCKSSKDRADVVWGLSTEEIEELVNNTVLEELREGTDNVEDYVSEDLIQNTTLNGKRYAIPAYQESVALFYNKDLVSEVPEDMDKFLDLCEEKGFAFNINNGYFSYGFLASCGGYVYKNENGVFNTDDIGLWNDGAIRGYEVLQDITVNRKIVALDTNDEFAESYFANGYTAFYLGEYKKIKSFEELDINFGVCKVPKIDGNEFKPFKEVKMAFVNPYAKNKDDSYELLKYLQENAGEIMINYGNRVPVLKKDIESDDFKNNEYLQGFYDQIKVAEVTPNICKFDAYWTIISRNLELLNRGELTPKECSESVKKDFDDMYK